jgi:hypothetical protein
MEDNVRKARRRVDSILKLIDDSDPLDHEGALELRQALSDARFDVERLSGQRLKL